MPNMNYSDMRAVSDQFRREAGMNRTYKRGNHDNLVYLLQSALYHNGYNLHLNGNYDDATEAAVRAYQRDNGFAQDGIMRPDMLHRLFPADPPAASATLPSQRPMNASASIQAPMQKQVQATIQNPIQAPIPMPMSASMPRSAFSSANGTANLAKLKPSSVPNPITGTANAGASQIRPSQASTPNPTASTANAAASQIRPRPRPAEYTIHLNSRNPEAVIRISYDRY